MLLGKSSKIVVDPSQLATLRQLPRHSAILAKFGIRLPKEAIVVVGSDGIKIVLPSAKSVEPLKA